MRVNYGVRGHHKGFFRTERSMVSATYGVQLNDWKSFDLLHIFILNYAINRFNVAKLRVGIGMC